MSELGLADLLVLNYRDLTVMEFLDFKDFLRIEKNYSVNTIKAYIDDLKIFSEFAKQQYTESDLSSVDYNMIRSWIVEMAEAGLSNRTINRKISSLQAYYKFLLQTNQIKTSPLVKYKSLKESKKVQIPFSQKEMQKFYDMEMPADFEGLRDRLMIELLYSSGIRRNELINIKLGDINSDSRVLKVKGKGNKDRIIPLIPTVFKTLDVYRAKRRLLDGINEESKDFLLLTKKGAKIYGTMVYRVVQNYFSVLSSKHKLSPHVLRHTFATHLLNEGADINSIKSLLGHESLSSTQVYIHNDIDALRKVYKKYHPRSNVDNS